MTYFSRFLSALKKLAGFFLFSLVGFFKPDLLYQVTANRPLSRSYWRLLQAFLWISAAMMIFLHPLTPILVLGALLAILPVILMAVSVDPFVSWLRGEDENPWHTFSRYISQGLWATIITMQPFLIALIAIVLVQPLFFEVFEGTDPTSPDSVSDLAVYLIFSFFMVIHFIYSQVKASARTSHKIVSAAIFSGCYLGLPIASAIAS